MFWIGTFAVVAISSTAMALALWTAKRLQHMGPTVSVHARWRTLARELQELTRRNALGLETLRESVRRLCASLDESQARVLRRLLAELSRDFSAASVCVDNLQHRLADRPDPGASSNLYDELPALIRRNNGNLNDLRTAIQVFTSRSMARISEPSPAR